jgi:hypothetical protein
MEKFVPIQHSKLRIDVNWVSGVGCWVLGVGCWVWGVGCWVLGVGCRVLGLGAPYAGFACGDFALMPSEVSNTTQIRLSVEPLAEEAANAMTSSTSPAIATVGISTSLLHPEMAPDGLACVRAIKLQSNNS